MRPFTLELWISVLFCMATLTIMLSAMCYMRKHFTGEDDVPLGLLDSFEYVYTSFCQQGCTTNPSAASSRIVCIVIKLTATVLVGGYSAYLIANLAVHKTILPFTDMESLLEDGTYKVGILANSHQEMFYKVSKTWYYIES